MLYIPENLTLSTAMVFTHNILSYDNLTFDRIKEVQYECLDMSHDLDALVAVVCQDDPEDATVTEEPFLRLCCTHETCDDSSDWIAPRRVLHHESHQMTGNVSIRQKNLQDDVHCPPGDRILSSPAEYVFTDGYFSTEEKTDRLPYICLSSSDDPSGIRAKVCQTEQDPGQSGEVTCLGSYVRTVRLANTISGTVSCVFLLITFLVYIKLPEFNNLHGRIVLSNIVSILLVTLYLTVVYHLSFPLSDFACQALGYLGYFFTMAMFSWMTIMSFDLCWTFRNSSPPGSTRSCLRFVSYSCLGWGLSGVLTLMVLVVDLTSPTAATRPGMGDVKCFLQDSALGLYLHLPVLSLLSLNIVFFLTTAVTLYRNNLSTKFARLGRRHTRQSKSLLVRQENLQQFVCHTFSSIQLTFFSLSRFYTASSSLCLEFSGFLRVSTTSTTGTTPP